MFRVRITKRRALIATLLFALLWCSLVVIWGNYLGMFAPIGWGVLYILGLAWVVYAVEQTARAIEARRRMEKDKPGLVWNPFDLAACYYFRHAQRLLQSLLVLGAYSILFCVLYILAYLTWGNRAGAHDYDLPSGGGSDAMQASSVKVQKVIRKKFVINPYSSIVFAAPPPIDQIDVKLTDESANRYSVGQGAGATGEGDGDGAGFGSGTGKGKIYFVRLKHGDRGWDKNFGIGGDRNMLAEYGARTKQKIAEETEYIEAAVVAKKRLPLLYISGSSSLPLSAADKKSLKQYITEQHGMILGDNLGGVGFHNAFVAAMNEITGVQGVAIPRDDRIHQRPYPLPQLPIVVAHGGTTPIGWKIDGRWVAYYHPGALSDAWRDDHAGIRKEVYELCYQLGVNVIYYAYREYNQWLMSQKQ